MSYDDTRTMEIRTGQGINVAAALAAGTTQTPEEAFNALGALVMDCVQLVHDVQAKAAIAAQLPVASVTAIEQAPSHPSHTEPFQTGHEATQHPVFVRQEAGGPVGPAPQFQHPQSSYSGQPQQSAPQPAAIPGATDGDPETAALWQMFLSDTTAWWDNRRDKRNPKAPDFKFKANGDKALWLTGRKNPSWVPGALAERGLG